MFEGLADRLERSFKILKGHGHITEINVAETLKEVRKALLDADVSYKIAKDFTEEVKQEVKTEKAAVAVSEQAKGIMSSLEKMTVLELADLVKALEDKFGVSAAAPVAMMGAGMAGGAGQQVAEEKTSFTVTLKETGSNKIQVIKEIRAVTSLGLKEAKDLVEAAPKAIKEGATKEEADKIKAQLEKVGAKVELS